MKKEPTPKPQHLPTLPNVKVGTIYGTYYDPSSFEYRKVTKIGSRTVWPDGPTDMVVYTDVIKLMHSEICIGNTWETEANLKKAFDCDMTVILANEDWDKLKHQVTMALQGFKARMEQTIKAALGDKYERPLNPYEQMEQVVKLATDSLTDIIKPHTPPQ